MSNEMKNVHDFQSLSRSKATAKQACKDTLFEIESLLRHYYKMEGIKFEIVERSDTQIEVTIGGITQHIEVSPKSY